MNDVPSVPGLYYATHKTYGREPVKLCNDNIRQMMYVYRFYKEDFWLPSSWTDWDGPLADPRDGELLSPPECPPTGENPEVPQADGFPMEFATNMQKLLASAPAPVAFQPGDVVRCVDGDATVTDDFGLHHLAMYTVKEHRDNVVQFEETGGRLFSAKRFVLVHRPTSIESAKTFTEQQVREALLAMKSHGYSLADKQSSFSIRYAVQQLASRLDISLAAVGLERGQT